MKLIKPSRRLFLTQVLAAPALITSPRLVEAFWQSRDSNYNQNIVAAGGATTTLDPANKSPNITLSGGNLTAVGGTGVDKARSIANYTTGKFYAEITSQGTGNYTVLLGIMDSSESLTAGNFANTTHSAGLWQGDAVIYGNVNSNLGTATVYANTNVVSMAVDLGASLLWYRVNGGIWNNNVANDPATGVGGADISFLGATRYAGVSCASQLTINFGGSAYAYMRPLGFGDW